VKKKIFLVFLIFLTTLYASAQVYYYRERSGKIVFTNLPDSRTRLFPSSYRSYFSFDLSSSSRKAAFFREYGGFIDQVSLKYGIDSKLIYSVIEVESNYRPYAVSRKGAKGLMQLLPETARSHGASDIFDPYANIEAGVKHLRHLLDYYKGDLTLALAAYNAGVKAVDRSEGLPPYRETRDYVSKVYSRYLGSSSIPGVDLAGRVKRVASSASGSNKTIYRYLDENGRVCFTNIEQAVRK
jgi:hypothetical protein